MHSTERNEPARKIFLSTIESKQESVDDDYEIKLSAHEDLMLLDKDLKVDLGEKSNSRTSRP